MQIRAQRVLTIENFKTTRDNISSVEDRMKHLEETAGRAAAAISARAYQAQSRRRALPEENPLPRAKPDQIIAGQTPNIH
jgi:hypothetical protein